MRCILYMISNIVYKILIYNTTHRYYQIDVFRGYECINGLRKHGEVTVCEPYFYV